MADPTQTAAPSSHAVPGPVQQFLDAYRREHAITAKVLRAYPPEQAELRPHERSSSALQLVGTFVVEERMMLHAVRGEDVMAAFGPPPADWADGVARFDAQHEEVVRAVEERGEALLQSSVHFFTGPKQMGDYPAMNFLWFLVHDQIHHRGQLSVYLRMAGGKVPSIYGPTADEPWT